MKKKEIKIKAQDFDPKKARDYKDFDKVMEGYEGSPTSGGGNAGGGMNWVVAIVAVVVVVASLTWLFRKKDKKDDVKIAQTEQSSELPLFKQDAPFEQYDVPYEIYEIPENGDVELLSKRGSIIRIPENAFVDENGMDVTEDVEVWFREFHNPFEIFSAGVPMTTKTEEGNTQLESAGMFEFRAFKDGKALQIKNGKKVDVSLVSWNDDPKFNEYILNEEEDQWDYVDRAQLSEEDYVNPTTYRPSNSEQIGTPYIDYDEERSLLNDEMDVVSDSLESPNNTIYAETASDYYFTVDMTKNELPEFANVGDLTFKVNTDKCKFDPSFYYVRWTDIDVFQDAESSDYIISLEKEDTTVLLVAEPIIDLVKNQERISEYEREAEERKKRNEERLSLTTQKNYIRPARSNRTNRLIEGAVKSSVDAPTYWNFSIQQVGWFNCDHPQYGAYATVAYVDFKDQYGADVEIAQMYMVDLESNTVIYQGEGHALRYNPKSHSVLWVVTPDGNIGITDTRAMDRRRLGPRAIMNVTVHNPDNGLRELKQIIG